MRRAAGCTALRRAAFGQVGVQVQHRNVETAGDERALAAGIDIQPARGGDLVKAELGTGKTDLAGAHGEAARGGCAAQGRARRQGRSGKARQPHQIGLDAGVAIKVQRCAFQRMAVEIKPQRRAAHVQAQRGAGAFHERAQAAKPGGHRKGLAIIAERGAHTGLFIKACHLHRQVQTVYERCVAAIGEAYPAIFYAHIAQAGLEGQGARTAESVIACTTCGRLSNVGPKGPVVLVAALDEMDDRLHQDKLIHLHPPGEEWPQREAEAQFRQAGHGLFAEPVRIADRHITRADLDGRQKAKAHLAFNAHRAPDLVAGGLFDLVAPVLRCQQGRDDERGGDGKTC